MAEYGKCSARTTSSAVFYHVSSEFPYCTLCEANDTKDSANSLTHLQLRVGPLKRWASMVSSRALSRIIFTTLGRFGICLVSTDIDQLIRWRPVDPYRNFPDIPGISSEPLKEENRTIQDDKRDLDWSTVLKRTFESYIRGERPNMYGEWIQW
jgi:hypothetical protein